jgi:hypothetical protein
MQSYKEFHNNTSIEEELMLSYYDRLDESDKKLLPRIYIRQYIINEGIIDSLSAKGKQVLSNICNSVSDVVHFLDKIKNELSQHLKVILTETKNKIKDKLKGDKMFLQAVKKQINIDRNAFMHDILTCKEVSMFYTSKFTESILNSVSKSLRNLLVHKKHDVFEEIKEALNINVIDSMIQHLHKVPPFAWLDMLHHTGAHGAAHLIHGLSYITKRLGGPEFKLPVMASLLGLAFEYNVKGLIKHGLIEAAEIFSLPFVGLVVKTAGNVATFLAAYELCRELSASIEKFQHYDHKPKDHTLNHSQNIKSKNTLFHRSSLFHKHRKPIVK